MDGAFGLLGGASGDGGDGGVPSGELFLTMSKGDDNQSMLYEVSSFSPVDDGDDYSDDLGLGLGLSIAGGGTRILTANDFPSLISKPNSSPCSSSSVNIPNSSTAGNKRAAVDSVSPSNSSSVVGWPPIRRAHRVPILANQSKLEHEEFSSRPERENKNDGYLSVKVNMDGTLIGRKVDLNAHSSCEMLAQTLEDMFYGRRSNSGASRSLNLLNGTSEFVLTYEDRDGDCMLVGDVPWPMFVTSIKRLRILRNSEKVSENMNT